MPFVSSVRGTFGPTSENRGVSKGAALSEFLRQDPNSSAAPTGGTITTAGGYRIHTFTANAWNSTLSSAFNTTNYGQTLDVEVLVVAGGAGGGAQVGGGGGAGGLCYSSNFTVGVGSTSVQVGRGGIGVEPYAGNSKRVGSRGANSTFGNISAIGGGGGGGHGSDTEQEAPFSGQETQRGRDGGCGGGSGTNNSSNNPGSATQGSGAGYTGFGFSGGNATQGGWSGGGGGGAGGVGGNSPGGSTPGEGGSGRQYSISGSSNFYAAGGGGCGQGGGPETTRTNGIGGKGVNDSSSDAGATGDGVAKHGTANTGSGGGGARDNSTGSGRGAAGIVILRYPL